jgi:hypothetical protein
LVSGKYLKKLRKDFQDRLGDAGTVAEECISNIRTVRSFYGEPKATQNYGDVVDKSYQIGKKLSVAFGNHISLIRPLSCPVQSCPVLTCPV